MWALITGLPGLISGAFGTINGITAAISNAKIAQINATTEQERIEAGEQIATLQARRDVLIAEAGSGSRINLIMRSCFALVALSVLTKLYFWDKVIGSLVGCSQAVRGTCGVFVTDPIDDNGWKLIGIVLSFYFVSEMTWGVTRLVKSK